MQQNNGGYCPLRNDITAQKPKNTTPIHPIAGVPHVLIFIVSFIFYAERLKGALWPVLRIETGRVSR